MQQGRPDQTVYTFEASPGVTMAYPDDELWTRDYAEARAYAQEKGYKVIGNDYEFEDSELVDDFTPAAECQPSPQKARKTDGPAVIIVTMAEIAAEPGAPLSAEYWIAKREREAGRDRG